MRTNLAKTMTVLAVAVAILLTSINAFAADALPQSGRTRITPNKLTIVFADNTQAPITIDTFRFFGYNVGQLRTITAALGGTINPLTNEYQIVSSGKAAVYNPIRFSIPQEVDYIINHTIIRDQNGTILYPNAPGWVYLPQYQYNWASIRDAAESLSINISGFIDDPTENKTQIVIGQPANNTTTTTYNGPQNGWASVLSPESSGNWNYSWYPPAAATTATTTTATTTTATTTTAATTTETTTASTTTASTTTATTTATTTTAATTATTTTATTTTATTTTAATTTATTTTAATTTSTTTTSATTTDECTVSCEVEAERLADIRADAYADHIAWNGAGSLQDSPERGAIYSASYHLIYDYAYALYEGYGEEIANSAADNLANSAAWDGAKIMIDEIIEGFGDGETTFQNLIYGMIFHLHYDDVYDNYYEEEFERLMEECEYHNTTE